MIMTSDVWPDKILEIKKLSFYTYQNIVGLPPKFHKGTVPKQHSQEMRHTAIQLRQEEQQSKHFSKLTPGKWKTKKQWLYQAGSSTVLQAGGDTSRCIYSLPCSAMATELRLLAQTVPFPFTDFALLWQSMWNLMFSDQFLCIWKHSLHSCWQWSLTRRPIVTPLPSITNIL